MLDETLSNEGMIYALTYDEKVISFSVVKYDDAYYLKMDKNPNLVRRLVIRPNFWVFFCEGNYMDCRSITRTQDSKGSLVKEFYIDPVIFPKLVKSQTITYSAGMADLYDLPREKARDAQFHKNDYKRTDSKEKVLTKLKNGIFN